MTSDMVLSTKVSQKTILAKLLASENITVEVKIAETAMFNTETRVLTLPQWKEGLSDSAYNMFTGHEVSHALNTPKDAWVKVMEESKIRNIPNSFYQIAEDARIERLIQEKFPGLKIDFVNAYAQFLKQGKFGQKAFTDINSMKFIDRFNIKMKCGSLVDINFSPEELNILKKAKSLKTFDDTLDMVDILYQYHQKEKAVLTETPPVNESSNEKPSDNLPIKNDGHNGTDDISDSDVDSETQIEFDDFTKKMLDFASEQIVNIYIPDIDPTPTIVSYDKLFASIGFDSKNGVYGNSFYKYKKASRDDVGYLAHLFNMHKNAQELQKVQFNKTGELDTARLYEYSFNNDLFVRKMIESHGKSHGLVLYLDWSSSMEDTIKHSIYQLLILTDFCKQVNIPFDVYAFTTPIDVQKNEVQYKSKRNGDLIVENMIMYHILSSDMNYSQYVHMQKILLSYKIIGGKLNVLHMHGTPLNQVIISAMTMVPAFKIKHKLDIVNTVFITDGDGSLSYLMYNHGVPKSFELSKKIYLHDRITGLKFQLKDQKNPLTPILLECLKERTGTNVIGFYLLGAADSKYLIKNPLDRTKFIKDHFVMTASEGYTVYYIIEVTSNVQDNKTDNGTLNGYIVKNSHLRTILSNFIKLIS